MLIEKCPINVNLGIKIFNSSTIVCVFLGGDIVLITLNCVKMNFVNLENVKCLKFIFKMFI